jgi:hypothetical protein
MLPLRQPWLTALRQQHPAQAVPLVARLALTGALMVTK